MPNQKGKETYILWPIVDSIVSRFNISDLHNALPNINIILYDKIENLMSDIKERYFENTYVIIKYELFKKF